MASCPIRPCGFLCSSSHDLEGRVCLFIFLWGVCVPLRNVRIEQRRASPALFTPGLVHKRSWLHDTRLGKQRRGGEGVASTLSAASCQQPGEAVG